ncbi:MAG: pilus assembly protein [Holosporaceae bacterium]|nr:pilus assembly protein [Holosporaceae bacterium]
MKKKIGARTGDVGGFIRRLKGLCTPDTKKKNISFGGSRGGSFFKRFVEKIDFLNAKNVGAVLIEFAFALPVLILVLYFICDVPTAHRFSSKLQKLSELYAQMLDNSIRKNGLEAFGDHSLKAISRGVGLTFSGVFDNKNHPFNLSTYIVAIQGEEGNKFKVLWAIHVKNSLNSSESDAITCNRGANSDACLYAVLDLHHTQHAGNIKELEIPKGERKILVETVAWYENDPRGFNKMFYMLTIPAKKVNGVRFFGDRTAIITLHDDFIPDIVPPAENQSDETGERS